MPKTGYVAALVVVGLSVIFASTIRELQRPAEIPTPHEASKPLRRRFIHSEADLTGRPVLLTLAAHIDPRACRAAWRLDEFYSGGSDEFHPVTRTIAIPTAVSTRILKLLVFCDGYEATIREFLHASPPEQVLVSPRELPAVDFRGLVLGIGRSVGQLDVRVGYYPWWSCRFLGNAECGMSGDFATTVPLERDGWFSVALPYYLHQPEVRANVHPGEFEFSIYIRNGGRLLYHLSPGTPSGRIPEQSWYWGNRQFVATRVR